MDTTFGGLLRRFRRERSLSQEALAHSAKVSIEAVRALEGNRRRFPRTSTVALLADALGCTPAERSMLEAAAARTSEPLRQLPPPLTDFTGRDSELDVLATHLRAGVTSPAVPVAAVTGMGGIGKTTLALQVANEVADQFPDGQLMLDLRGFSSSGPIEPPAALGILLRALGTPAGQVPSELAEATALYRSAIAGRRVLLVLDNAADSAQVEPLIPGVAGSAVVITSRRVLSGLPSARGLQLAGLTRAEAVRLLAEVGGPAVSAEPAAAERIVEYCARLPLAVRLAGVRLIGRSARAVRNLADRLADESRRMDALDDHGRGVRGSIAVSVEGLAASDDPLDVEAARILPLVAVVDGSDLSVRTASRVAGVSPELADRLLDRLADVSLLEARTPTRYHLHDLIASYFGERTTASQQRRIRMAVLRTHSALLWRVKDLSARRSPRLRESWGQPDWATDATDLADRAAVLDLLDDERDALLATLRWAVNGSAAERELSVRIGVAMSYYGIARKRWAEWRDVAALTAPLATDAATRAMLLADHGLARSELGDFEHAAEPLVQAVDVLAAVDNPSFEISTLVNLSHVLERSGRLKEGLRYGLRARDLAASIGDREDEALALLVLGMISGGLGDAAQHEYFAGAVDAMRSAGPPRGLATVLQQISLSYRECGDLSAAVGPLEESLRIYQEDDAGPYLPEIQEDLGWLRHLSGDTEAALRSLAEALSGAQKFQLWDREASVRVRRGQILADAGQRDEARDELTAALAVYRERGLGARAEEARQLLSSL
ncbi:NB-ARC domain-containing protein [Kribbella amoyensis]|uniref:NB-ARC domain-containing protein n=1 Tax=Kribbella amoyensis TaxID=996641 RepID=A0A561B369_9ACTN|nr:XRE family transcriptional regulator [Kribbella amoyensis]TWD73306.1 NB-ARC domain-containing protein [Kribbella amoyensis]